MIFNKLFLLLGINVLTAQLSQEELLPPQQEVLELSDEFESLGSMGQLQAGRDVVVNAAAFEFSQVFFRLRGYDNSYAPVLLNGFVMNKFDDGRPQWNNWGGLNAITRNQEFHLGLQKTAEHMGGLLGLITINTNPGGLRPGINLVASSSNRTYANRLMASIVSKQTGGFAYALAASGRWANSGFIEGTPYESYALMGAAEIKLGHKGAITFTGIAADNRRGRSAPITKEVVALKGPRYNPYWGYQDGRVRNSRKRRIWEPMLMVNYSQKLDPVTLTAGVKYQWGLQSRSRLGYYGAPNPDPTYYQYLAGFYYNSPFGANSYGAEEAREGFGQINWSNLYEVNNAGPAFYLLSGDVSKSQDKAAFLAATAKLNKSFSVAIRSSFRYSDTSYFAVIEDLLGADHFLDEDPFSQTANDLLDLSLKGEGDKINYHYKIKASESDIFLQARVVRPYWEVFLASRAARRTYQREGIYKNEKFPNSSMGPGRELVFNTLGVKAGMSAAYKRVRLKAAARLDKIPPVIRNSYINPRENHWTLPGDLREKRFGIDVDVLYRLPGFKSRISAYYTRIMNASDVNFFFTETAIGSDFVQEVIRGLDYWHKGLEIGIAYQPSSTVSLKGAASLGKFVHARNPEVELYIDGYGDGFPIEGNSLFAGKAGVKGYRLSGGPQEAYSLGISYNDPSYWWVGFSLNYLRRNYPQLAFLQYTDLFWSESAVEGEGGSQMREIAGKYLRQSPWPPVYLANLIGGKSWKIGQTYIGLFFSLNNLLDQQFKSGGYKQGRKGHYAEFAEDQVSNSPLFGEKAWYGYGRTYFLNLSYSF